ncbi:MAG: aminoglycoside phosphotransferase family protein [Phycisphaerales bacterium]|nr:aminoglycoside phosphotransferase family protein [Phycisphaerales bacterium]
MGEGATDKREAANAAASPSPGLHRSPPQADSGSLAAMLCPVLQSACEGRLSPVQWFRSAWQAGGASTGTATYQLTPTRSIDVVVKLPVGPLEYQWTTRVGACEPAVEHHTGPTPRVLAAGAELGGYDLAWLVVEKLAGQPLSAMLSHDAVQGLLHAAAVWYKAAADVRDIADCTPPKRENWADLIARGREAVRDNSLPDEQRWNEALKHVQRVLPRLVQHWEARRINTWCHGDLHPGNAMLRAPVPGANGDTSAAGRCVLIDLALVHAGHWVEDALYLERLFWAKPDMLFGIKPVATVARFRRELGLDTSDDYGSIALLRRTLMAATVPAFLEHEGHPKYVRSALDVLERSMRSMGL